MTIQFCCEQLTIYCGIKISAISWFIILFASLQYLGRTYKPTHNYVKVGNQRWFPEGYVCLFSQCQSSCSHEQIFKIRCPRYNSTVVPSTHTSSAIRKSTISRLEMCLLLQGTIFRASCLECTDGIVPSTLEIRNPLKNGNPHLFCKLWGWGKNFYNKWIWSWKQYEKKS